jgi:hypothetical protein
VYTPRSSREPCRYLCSQPNLWARRGTAPPRSMIFSPMMTSLLRAPALGIYRPLAVSCYEYASWRMYRGHSQSRWKLGTHTPRQTRACRPWLTPRRTARTYTSGGSTGCLPRRCTHNATSSPMLVTSWAAHGPAHVKSNKPSSRMPTAPHSLRRAGKTSPPRRCSYATYPSLQTLNSRSSTATSGHWWSVLLYSRREAPRHATGM